jgi:acyl-CoA synthetase (AMP-forming)/AMP-acid ligase II
MAFKTHLSIVEETATRYPSRPAFRIPVVQDDGTVVRWNAITFAQFSSDLKLVAKYWSGVLRQQGIPSRSTVGLWYADSFINLAFSMLIIGEFVSYRISGLTYSDLVHIYAVSKAGYIPQLFSIRLPCADVIYELLSKANAKALIYEPSFQSVISDAPVPAHLALPCGEAMGILALDGEELPDKELALDDPVFYFHSSGSTSGMPKVVPYTYTWLNSAIAKSYHIMKPRKKDGQDVTTWMYVSLSPCGCILEH